MDHCQYCRGENAPGTPACPDCQDYAAAARVAAGVVEEAGVGGALAAAIGAEIAREYLLRSMHGARARQPEPRSEDLPRRRPLL